MLKNNGSSQVWSADGMDLNPAPANVGTSSPKPSTVGRVPGISGKAPENPQLISTNKPIKPVYATSINNPSRLVEGKPSVTINNMGDNANTRSALSGGGGGSEQSGSGNTKAPFYKTVEFWIGAAIAAGIIFYLVKKK